jgi:hypothetical protein
VDRLRWTGALFALLMFAQVGMKGQAVNGTVVGTVRDSSGGLVPGADVTITNTGTSTSRSSTTDANGYYTFPIWLRALMK